MKLGWSFDGADLVIGTGQGIFLSLFFNIMILRI